MVHHDFSEEFARLLDVERQEAEFFLRRFSAAMVAELLAVRKLSLKGLGSFTVAHFPAAKKSRASTVVYTPPGNRLTFTTRMTGSDDTSRLAISRLSMSPEEAERFGGALAALFRRAVQEQREICLNGMGRFTLEQGAWLFFPERTLEELLNREYQDLQEVVLPPRGRMQKKLLYLVPLLVCLIIVLLFTFRHGMAPKPVASLSVVQQPLAIAKVAVHAESPTAVVRRDSLMVQNSIAPPAERPIAVVRRDSALVQKPITPPAEMAEANGSLVLAPESYTVVLITLSKAESVHKEVVRLRSEKVIAFVWPAEVKGIKYYRLITGSFSSHHAATERIGQMAQTTAKGAYIQHITKRVVLHGEKGL